MLRAVDDSGTELFGTAVQFMACTKTDPEGYALIHQYSEVERLYDFVRVGSIRKFSIIPVSWIKDQMGYYDVDDGRYLFHNAQYVNRSLDTQEC